MPEKTNLTSATHGHYYSLDLFFCLKEVLLTSPSVWNQTNKKSLFDWRRSLKKALSAPHKGILFPGDWMPNPILPLAIKEARDCHLKPVIQIPARELKTPDLKTKLNQVCGNSDRHNFNTASGPLGLNVVFYEPEQIENHNIQDLPFTFYWFTYLVLKKNFLINLSKKLPPDMLKQTEFYFPFKRYFHDPFLTPKGVYKYIKKHKPFQTARPYTGDVYDSKISWEKDLEPITEPFFETKAEKPPIEPDFSVIIPSYNNKVQLIKTLQSLIDQDYKRTKFEIIVIDDGSNDGSFKALKDFINQHKSHHMKAIHFPRVRPRKLGQADFRAGLARNLGTKYASGKYLAFLDGDILTPPHYLTQLQKEHESGADLVQLKRYHLKKNISPKQFHYDYEKLKNFVFIEDKSYWGLFYEKGFSGVSCPWKYTCTYGLSLLKKEFLLQGRFGKTFLYYGFEDTDLGYRLFKSGKKLLLSQIKCYHQFVSGNQREDRRNNLRRHSLLSKTAKIFFYRHLDPVIFEELRPYMAQERGLAYFLKGFLKT